MKFIQITLMLVVLLCVSVMVKAQDTTAVVNKVQTKNKQAKKKFEKKHKTVYWGLKAGGGQVLWDNDLEGYQSENSMAFQGGFFIEVRPIKYVSIETGATYFMMKPSSGLASFYQTHKGVDSEGDAVEYRFAAERVVEDQTVDVVNIPLAIKLNAFAGNWEFYGKAGMMYRYAINTSYKQTGVYSNHGYYEQWDLLIDDLPQQGYYSNSFGSEEGELKWKNTFDPFVGAGIVFPGKGTSFFIEGLYYLGGTDLTEPKQDRPFENRMSNTSQYEQVSGSLMEMGKNGLSGFMVNIGLRF